MERKSVAFEQLSDIFGFRVIVNTVAGLLSALGVVHTTWPVVPGRFKDYISTPKQNDYRSIHTTVIGPGQQRVELQVRTQEMHDIAEYGIAAHALYKDGAVSPTEMLSREVDAYAWLRRTIELLAEGANPEEFLEHTKLELFHDQVFCFTPKGRLIALPRGATPIDFAYAVHTDVGNTAVGCQDQRPASRRCCRNCKTATRSRSSTSKAQTRRRPPGNRSSSPARRAPRSGARRAMPCARNMPGLDVRSSSGCLNAPGRLFGREADRRAAAARAHLDRGGAGGGRARRNVFRRCRAGGLSGIQGRARRAVQRPSGEAGWFGLSRRQVGQAKVPEARRRGAIPIRGSTAICRCVSRPMAAPCRATGSSAF